MPDYNSMFFDKDTQPSQLNLDDGSKSVRDGMEFFQKDNMKDQAHPMYSLDDASGHLTMANDKGMEAIPEHEDKMPTYKPTVEDAFSPQGKDKKWSWMNFLKGAMSTAVPGFLGGMGTLGDSSKGWMEGAMPGAMHGYDLQQKADVEKQKEDAAYSQKIHTNHWLMVPYQEAVAKFTQLSPSMQTKDKFSALLGESMSANSMMGRGFSGPAAAHYKLLTSAGADPDEAARQTLEWQDQQSYMRSPWAAIYGNDPNVQNALGTYGNLQSNIAGGRAAAVAPTTEAVQQHKAVTDQIMREHADAMKGNQETSTQFTDAQGNPVPQAKSTNRVVTKSRQPSIWANRRPGVIPGR